MICRERLNPMPEPSGLVVAGPDFPNVQVGAVVKDLVVTFQVREERKVD